MLTSLVFFKKEMPEEKLILLKKTMSSEKPK